MELIARLGNATLANVGYRFYDNAGAAIGARRTAAIVALPETGSFVVVDGSVPSNATAVYWNDSVTLVDATEQLRDVFRLDAVPTTGQIRTELATELAEVTAIKAKTDNLPAEPASRTNITGGVITTVTNLTNAPTAGDLTATMKASVDTAVWGAGTRTLTSFGSLVADMATAVWGAATRTLSAFGFTVAPTASQNAAAVRVELATELARADVATSTRLAAADYTAPDNAGIDAIEALLDGAEKILLSEVYVPTALPVLIIPTPDPDELLSVVYAYTESITNEVRAGIVLTFTLDTVPSKSERILETASKDTITDEDGYAEITLQRNVAYRVKCQALGLHNRPFTPTTATFDLLSII